MGKLIDFENLFICIVMNQLFTQSEFDRAKSRDSLPLKCKVCQQTFYKPKNRIQKQLKGVDSGCKYCSFDCAHIGKKNGKFLECKWCKKEIYRTPERIRKVKMSFCSGSCSAKYHNTHKTYGFTRSKLEVYIESKLKSLYNTFELKFNKTEDINSELDIYIPSLKLAFELNGPIHYEPIFGGEKLKQTKNNDNRKFQACLERGIELCIIDTSKPKNFSEKSGDRFLKMIVNVIKKKTDIQVAQSVDVCPHR